MAGVIVTTGNDEFTAALVGHLEKHGVQVVEDGPVSHAVVGVPRGAAMADAAQDALDRLDPQCHVVFLANGLGDHAAVEVVRQSPRAWTVVHPNAMMDYSFAALAPQILMGVAFGMSGRGRVGFVALADVARVVSHVVQEGGHDQQEYVCTGPEALDMPAVVATLSEVIGRQIDYVDLPEVELADLMMQHAGVSDRTALDDQVLSHLRSWRDGQADVVTGTVADLTGQQPLSVRAWFEQHRQDFDAKPSLVQKAAHRMIKARYGGRILR
jgi:hypothetical protein